MEQAVKEKENKVPVVTKKYPIELPPAAYYGNPAVYKVWFGKSYFVWKGKSLKQSADQLSESIERYLRLDKNDPESVLYVLCAHIKKTRCMRAKIEMVDSDLRKDGSSVAIDVYRMLRLEQDLLNEAASNHKCLNYNQQAYIPNWMENDAPAEVQKFLRGWNK